jgi:hypothetical protein
MTEPWTPAYERWRHGGWYVTNLRYPSGAVGCVTRNFADRKWRIACDPRPEDHTYPTRDAAARAERDLVLVAARVALDPGQAAALAELVDLEIERLARETTDPDNRPTDPADLMWWDYLRDRLRRIDRLQKGTA